jgi:hypothetical protein
VQQVLNASLELSRIQPQRRHQHDSAIQLAMFAPSLGRVARSTSSISSSPVITLCRAALSTGPRPFRPSHQRRYSSSKSSIPPSSKKKPAEDVEQNAASQLQGAEVGAKSKGKAAEIPVTTSMNNVPHVRPTTHIDEGGKCFGWHLHRQH